MKLTKTAAAVTLAGALGVAACRLGVGLAQADPPPPAPTPPPGGPTTTINGPSVGVAPGNPPGQDFLPPQGHSGPMPPDMVAPPWAPPAPPPPAWAPWLPVVWNSDLQAWGVWWNNSFHPL